MTASTPTSLIPNLMVGNVARSLAFYCDVLGFAFLMGVVEEGGPVADDRSSEKDFLFAMVNSGGATLMLQSQESLREDVPAFAHSEPGASVSFFMEVPDLDALVARVSGHVTPLHGPRDTWYGMREWYIADPDGYVLCFSQRRA